MIHFFAIRGWDMGGMLNFDWAKAVDSLVSIFDVLKVRVMYVKQKQKCTPYA